MPKQFELYWLRETGCDTGALLHAHQLEAAIRERVLALAGTDDRLRLELPFFDQREWRRRAEVLRATRLVREGSVIRSVPANAGAAMRDHAAALLALDPAWQSLPDERELRYFPVWQRVSTALQQALRNWIPKTYFLDLTRFEDREAAYPVLVYEASRPFSGRPRTEFTYDAADPLSLPSAWRMMGRSLQDVLASVEQRLYQAGQPELARRYAPIWCEDIRREVAKHPRPFVDLLAQEAMLINAIIDLGTAKNMSAVKPFAKNASTALRRMAGVDMRPLAHEALKLATSTLAQGLSVDESAPGITTSIPQTVCYNASARNGLQEFECVRCQ